MQVIEYAYVQQNHMLGTVAGIVHEQAQIAAEAPSGCSFCCCCSQFCCRCSCVCCCTCCVCSSNLCCQLSAAVLLRVVSSLIMLLPLVPMRHQHSEQHSNVQMWVIQHWLRRDVYVGETQLDMRMHAYHSMHTHVCWHLCREVPLTALCFFT